KQNLLLLSLRFRTNKTCCCCRCAFAQTKPAAAVAALSHKQNLLLPLRCTHAFAQKTSVGPRPWNEAGRGTKAKSITSCDNAFVTNILLPRRPQEALLCAKAKRQQRSAQL
ncbi:hypothetical protein ACFTQ7_01480, partial [Lysinibacillus sp. NPDC056959]|uniref:hypothetical protein n=1 Tax=Lysinibacillus sp. NPDC056959 TaxID=3345981 RepID=UPI00362CC578